MRLIDADKLPFDIMPEDIDNAPTIGAVPVVRCAKCKNREEYKTFPDGLFCPYINAKVPPDGYCYMGEEDPYA